MAWPAAVQAAVAGGGMSIGGNIVSNVMNRRNTAEANDWQNEANTNAMAFEERMSSSAHQREVDDLRKAGLNPILSANKGAQGASGIATQQGPASVPDFAGAASSALEAMRVEKDIRGTNSQIALNGAMGTAALAQATNSTSASRQADAQTRLMNATIGASSAEAKTRKSQAEIDLQDQQYQRINKNIKGGLDTLNSAKQLINPINIKQPGNLNPHKNQDAIDWIKSKGFKKPNPRVGE